MAHIYQAVLLILLCYPAYCQQSGVKTLPSDASQSNCDAPDDAEALKQVSQDWKNGYNNGEAAKVAGLYTEDAYYLTQHIVTGIVHGRREIQAYVQRGADAHYHLDDIQVISLHCSNNFAYTVTRYESTNNGQKAIGVNLVVLRKIANRWLIVAHESAVPDPATAIQQLNVTAQ
jgi:uncharacterized protein (TIGR02246 family)